MLQRNLGPGSQLLLSFLLILELTCFGLSACAVVSLAFALRSYQLSYHQMKYFSLPGELLMRMLQMLVLPLIVSSLGKQFQMQYCTLVVTRMIVRTENGSELGASMSPSSSVENETGNLENVTLALGTLQEVISFEETVSVPGSAMSINALGLVVFSVAFALVIGGMKHKGHVLRDFFDSHSEAN